MPGYYSIASRKWVSWQEVEEADRSADETAAKVSDAYARVAKIEAEADAAAAKGDYALAREILSRLSETHL